jgi:hypothetical protein
MKSKQMLKERRRYSERELPTERSREKKHVQNFLVGAAIQLRRESSIRGIGSALCLPKGYQNVKRA